MCQNARNKVLLKPIYIGTISKGSHFVNILFHICTILQYFITHL